MTFNILNTYILAVLHFWYVVSSQDQHLAWCSHPHLVPQIWVLLNCPGIYTFITSWWPSMSLFACADLPVLPCRGDSFGFLTLIISHWQGSSLAGVEQIMSPTLGTFNGPSRLFACADYSILPCLGNAWVSNLDHLPLAKILTGRCWVNHVPNLRHLQWPIQFPLKKYFYPCAQALFLLVH